MIGEMIVTERLILRRPTPDDIQAIYVIHSDPRTLEYNPGDTLRNRDEAAALFRRWDEQWTLHGFGYFVVVTHDHRTVTGFCGVKLVVFRGHRVLNLFYRFAPEHWGKGYASEASVAVVASVDAALTDYPLIAKVRPGNTASRSIVEKIGLIHQPDLTQMGDDGVEDVFTRRWPLP